MSSAAADVLSTSGYLHIVELILLYSTPNTFNSLRNTCGTLRTLIDGYFFSHILYTDTFGPLAQVDTHKIRFNTLMMAPDELFNVRILDIFEPGVHTGTIRTFRLSVPTVWCVRINGDLCNLAAGSAPVVVLLHVQDITNINTRLHNYFPKLNRPVLHLRLNGSQAPGDLLANVWPRFSSDIYIYIIFIAPDSPISLENALVEFLWVAQCLAAIALKENHYTLVDSSAWNLAAAHETMFLERFTRPEHVGAVTFLTKGDYHALHGSHLSYLYTVL